MTASKIEWTERSDWNPVRGCTRMSEGCRHCFAEQIAGRFSGEGQPFHGFATRRAGEGRWTGRVELVEDRLTLPLRWRKPATIFASSTSDIFHESLPDGAIDRIFAVMALAPQHTFQVLTKRAERMREYLSGHVAPRLWQAARAMNLPDAAYLAITAANRRTMLPLPNVWLGVSVEDQEAADARVPHLLATPAALRFLSCEPLLAPVRPWHHLIAAKAARLTGRPSDELEGIDWVIAGGESGRGARPMHPDWARSLRDQCAATGVPFFFKQWGEWALLFEHVRRRPEIADWSPPRIGAVGHYLTVRLGRQAAGRLLDGIEHNGLPA